MPKHSVKLAATKRKRAAPLDAGVTRGVPADQIPPDLRIKRINDRHLVHVRLEAPLVAGCDVALLYMDKRYRTKIGRYWPGPPQRFAEFVDPWGDDRGDKVERRKPVGEGYPVRLVGLIVRYPRAP
jgi:hypothetical protein